MKKILAILVAFAMLFAFAACNKDKAEDGTTAAPQTTKSADDIANKRDEIANQDPVTEVVTNVDADGNVVTEVVTEETPAGFNSIDPAEIAAFYVAASNKTRDDAKEPAGHQSMVLVGEISGDGAIGTLLEVLNPIVADVLADNSTSTDYIPGASRGDLQADDIVADTCYAQTDENGNTTLYIELKKQVDGPDCDGHEAGPVARGIGTLGSIDTALEALGAELNSGRDTVTLTYRDAYIECVVNADGYIVSGTWHYIVDVNIGNAKAKISIISANLKNLKAAIEYTVEI